MRIRILGPLDVRDPAARPVPVSGRRLRALLIRLAADAGRAVSAERLLDDLWEGAPPTGGGNAVQALVSRLRAVAGRELVTYGPGGYRLGVDPAEVDAVVFERLVVAARGEGDPARRAATLRRALELWRGPALADAAGAGFAAPHVARLDELRIAAIEDRVDAELAAGLPAPPAAELAPLAAAHPLRERLRGQLMRALYAAGRQAEALGVYEETRRALSERLGVDPSPELSAVHLAILRGEAAGPGDRVPGPAVTTTDSAPAPVAGGRLRTNLPARLTSFVGREEESRRVGKLLRETRLVTLTGPGGAGKTRLAAESTAGFLDEVPDGVWFVPLASVRDGGDVVPAVLDALGVPDPGWSAEGRAAVPLLDRLTDLLAAKRMVLILDNCEHLIDAVAGLVDHVLGFAPGVRVLATSREPLGITGEALCPVPSLPLPPAGVADPAEAARYASVRLFADRAAAVRPGFEVDEATVADVVATCRALDGIPLAIELAAARLRSLTPGQVAARLGDRFRLLTGGSRTALPRHRTLRAVVDWSWDLLTGVERVVLRRLSVFAGGAGPDAAVRVCGLDAPGAPAAGDVIDVIAALIDKSLIMTDGGAEVRYRLLETVRAYAAERLDEAGETARVRSAHAAYFTELAERAEPELRRADQLRWTERLTAERDNVAAAFRHVADAGDARTGLRLVGALTWFWMMRDLEKEAGAWALPVLEAAGDTAPDGLEEQYAICVMAAGLTRVFADPGPTAASLLEVIDGVVATLPESPRHPLLALIGPVSTLLTGDMERSRAALRTVEDHPDPWIRGVARTVAGHIAINTGRIDEAAGELAAGYDGLRALGDRFGMMLGLSGMTQVALARGDTAEAVRLGEEAYGYATEGVSPEQGAAMLMSLARARIQQGDMAQARSDLERAVAAMVEVGEFADAAGGSLMLSELARREGDRAGARALAERAYAWVEPRRGRPDFSQVFRRAYSELGRLAEEEGDLAAAARWHARAFDGIEDSPLTGNPSLADLTTGLAAFTAAHGDHARAAELLGAAHALRGYRDASAYDVIRTEDATGRALGAAGFTAAYERGRRLGRDDVLVAAAGPPATA